jgi:hypothetical protein
MGKPRKAPSPEAEVPEVRRRSHGLIDKNPNACWPWKKQKPSIFLCFRKKHPKMPKISFEGFLESNKF